MNSTNTQARQDILAFTVTGTWSRGFRSEMVAAESVEHAIALAKNLPPFKVVALAGFNIHFAAFVIH